MPQPPSEDARHKAAHIDQVLSDTYAEPEWAPRLDGISELVLTILSQHTSDRNSSAAFDKLYSHYNGSWDAVMTAPTDELATVIRGAGLSNIKAPRIQGVLAEVRERVGRLHLDFLAEMPLDQATAWLTSLNGVGPKTAACVLLFSYGLPAMPVDTHVHRVARRTGLIGPKVTADAAHRLLPALVPAHLAYRFHINLIRHGRAVCKAPVPRCALCPISDVCNYFRSVIAESSSTAVRGWKGDA